MNADVMITIVFVAEVLLFALAAGVLIARHLRKAQREAAGERGIEPREPEAIGPSRQPATTNPLTAADASEPLGGRGHRALRGLRS